MQQETRFSQSTGSFYPLTENYPELPGDLVTVPMEDYRRAVEAWARGDSVSVSSERILVTPRPAPTAAQLKAQQLALINVDCEKVIAALQSSYPASEVLSWPKQETEARAWVADNSLATPLLDSLAKHRGIEKSDLVRRVLSKSDAFAEFSGAAIGKRQALEDALDALPADATPEEIVAITW